MATLMQTIGGMMPTMSPAGEAQPRRDAEPRGPEAAAVVEPRHGLAVLVDQSLLLVAEAA